MQGVFSGGGMTANQTQESKERTIHEHWWKFSLQKLCITLQLSLHATELPWKKCYLKVYLETALDHNPCRTFVTTYNTPFGFKVFLTVTFARAFHQCSFLNTSKKESKTPQKF